MTETAAWSGYSSEAAAPPASFVIELSEFSGPLDLLRFSPLSMRSRVRMGVAVLRLQRAAARGTGVAPYEAETAAAWVWGAERKEGRSAPRR